VAHCRYHTTTLVHFLRNTLHVLIIWEVPHGSKPADVEDRIEVSALDIFEGHRRLKLLLHIRVRVEINANCVVLARIHATRVKRCEATLWGSESDLESGILKDLVRMSRLR